MQSGRGQTTHRAVSIFSKVSSTCSKKLRTKGLENSRSLSSSSISRIWEKVPMSTWSPKSGRASSFCERRQLSAVRSSNSNVTCGGRVDDSARMGTQANYIPRAFWQSPQCAAYLLLRYSL